MTEDTEPNRLVKEKNLWEKEAQKPRKNMKSTTRGSGRFQDKKQTNLQHATTAQNAAKILSPAATAVKKWQIYATRPAVL